MANDFNNENKSEESFFQNENTSQENFAEQKTQIENEQPKSSQSDDKTSGEPFVEYYVHKSNGYVPPDNNGDSYGDYNRSNNFQNDYRNENPYDKANGVFSGGTVPKRKNTNGLGITSMILGIISVVLCCCGEWVTVIIAAAGLAFGIVSLCKSKNGFAIAGIITSAVGLVFGIIGVALNSAFNEEEFWEWFDSLYPEDPDFSSPEYSSPEHSGQPDHNQDAFIGDLLFLIKLKLGL